MKTYTDNEHLNFALNAAVAALETGAVPSDLEVMVKNKPTSILLADAAHEALRYRPGSKLVTYNGVDASGTPIQETWGGGVADIIEGSVILRNEEPLYFPEGHPNAGEPVRGSYREDGSFAVDAQNEGEVLFNEYVSDIAFVSQAYAVTPSTSWQTGFKQDPSYVLAVPKSVEGADIFDLHTEGNAAARVYAGDVVVIDTRKGKITSVHGCERQQLEKTYVALE